MGVQKLTSYIDSNSDVMKSRAFRNSKLIIDGSNLYYNLYYGSKLDQVHGGEYEAFEKQVTRFFRNLELCEIKPYIVLDGGDDISGKKFETLKTRAEDRIRRTDSLSRGCSGEALPILIKNVFKQILRKLKVPFIQCMAEGDWDAAALANEWNCPVLSKDSDFYIFDIKGGFFHFSHFEWRRVRTLKTTGERFIQTKTFSVNRFCAKINNMNKKLLPIFATILGNDYANLDRRILPNWSRFSRSPGKHRQIDGLLQWLSGFQSPEEAIREIQRKIKNPRDSEMVKNALTEGLKEYRLSSSSIAQFFKTGDPQSRLPAPLQQLPQWFLKGVAEGKLNSILLDVLTLHRVMLNFSVQDFSRSSNSLTSGPIRQVFYGLMLSPNPRRASRAQFEVEEYDREGLTLVSYKVPAILPSQAAPGLCLETLLEVPLTVRQQVFLEALGASQAPDRLLVPPSLQLAVYVTCYWLKQAQPEPEPEFLGAMLVGLVYGELSRDPGSQRDLALMKLKKLKGKEKMPLDLEVAHSFSQWQSSMRDSICLNQLLDNPVPEPEYARLYSGLLVHQVVRELRRGVTPEVLLAGSPAAVELYHNLRSSVELYHRLRSSVEHELLDNSVRRMRVMVRQQNRPPVRQEPADEVTYRFEQLTCEEEEDDEDLPRKGKKGEAGSADDEILDQTCRIRTRHRKRSGTKDPRSRKYERGW